MMAMPWALSLLITPNNLMLNHTKCPKYKNSLNFQAIFISWLKKLTNLNRRTIFDDSDQF